MVKEIFLKRKYTNEAFLGTFLDDTNYDVLLTEDADVYKPSPWENDRDDSNVLLKFRKGVFSEKIQKNAYDGLKEGATSSHNRGLAAGPIEGDVQKQNPNDENGREWVSDYQFEVLNYFIQPSQLSLDNGDKLTLSKIREKFKETKTVMSSIRGNVWLANRVKEHDFEFEKWADEVEKKPKKDQMEDARFVMETLVSNTNYANPVFSGVGGFYDRYPRIPYCRATSYTANNKEKFDIAIPFIDDISEWFSKLIPNRWKAQKEAIDKLDSSYKIGNSVYTTITINKNFRTAAHRDAGDLEQGFGNLTALSSENNGWKGGFLCFPEFRVAVDIRPGDVLLMDVHEIHGNTKIEPLDGKDTADRISIVCYFRENMFGCSLKKYEDVRKEFVSYCQKNKSHEFYRKNWNGIYPEMFKSKEWFEYILNTQGEDFLKQFHPEAMRGNLEDLF